MLLSWLHVTLEYTSNDVLESFLEDIELLVLGNLTPDLECQNS